jgi:hypothetical protein
MLQTRVTKTPLFNMTVSQFSQFRLFSFIFMLFSYESWKCQVSLASKVFCILPNKLFVTLRPTHDPCEPLFRMLAFSYLVSYSIRA